MKKIVLVLCLAVATFAAVAQTGWVYTESKDGKSTHKECLGVYVGTDTVIFVVSKTAYQVFAKAGTDAKGISIWVDYSTNKIVTRAMDNGRIVFWKNEKKAYYYK